ncbi:MAG: diguanylate cyclase [Actinobacteria bacterium]|nr:diguanylate cyclase [Actinomycetota bacterium]
MPAVNKVVDLIESPDTGAAVSQRLLAEVIQCVLSEQTLDSLLSLIADALRDLIPYDTLTIYQADEPQRTLVPVVVRDQWAEQIFDDRCLFGEGITGWAVEERKPVLANDALSHPRATTIRGTPEEEPEALMSIPLIARGSIKGALNIYRIGDNAHFGNGEFELAQLFADAAALGIDNAQARAALEHQAQTDSLTGLYNHRHFHERLKGELTRANRTNDSVTLLMLDLDDFKRVNDVLGHGVGDELLRALADCLRKVVRASDTVCRVGGEEFAVIMPSCGAEAALVLAERLSDDPPKVEAMGPITFSAGIAQGPADTPSAPELAACAEVAMMTAKAQGKARTLLFDGALAERPGAEPTALRDVRSIAHLKLLRSLASKLNRLNDVRQIGKMISEELRTLIDYSTCRVYVVEGDNLVPIALSGELSVYGEENVEVLSCKVGEGIAGVTAESGGSLLIDNSLECEFAATIPGTPEIAESVVAVPLIYDLRTVGVVVITKLAVGKFDDADVRLLEVMAGHASVALENARLYQAERREADHAKALLEFSRSLATAHGQLEVLTRIVGLSASILDSPRTSVWLQDPVTRSMSPQAMWGYTDGRRKRVAGIRFDEGIATRLLAGAEPYILRGSDVPLAPGIIAEDRACDWAIAPFRLDGDRLGAICAVVKRDDYAFSEGKMRLLGGIAHQAKLAVSNAGSFERLEETFLSTIEALANALEAKDEHTSTHARSIRDMAMQLGRRLHLDATAQKRLELGALFHDIGKIGIPSEILSKPGPLTREERRIVQTHPEVGERILAPIERLADVRPIVRACHEHFDGGGYPEGKAGHDIPIEARIILVCDAFDAMTTDRSYRKALPVEEAVKRLERGAGRDFDPAVAKEFLLVLRFGSRLSRAS